MAKVRSGRPGRPASSKNTPTSQPRSSSVHSASIQRRSRRLQNESASSSKGNAPRNENLTRDKKLPDPKSMVGAAISSKLAPLKEASEGQPPTSTVAESPQGGFHIQPAPHVEKAGKVSSTDPTKEERKLGNPEHGHPTMPRSEKAPRKSIGDEAKRLAEIKAQRAQETIERSIPAPPSSPPKTMSFEPQLDSNLGKLMRDPKVDGKRAVEIFTNTQREDGRSYRRDDPTDIGGRAFIDAQKGAMRVPWNEDSQELPPRLEHEDEILALSEESQDDSRSTGFTVDKRQNLRGRKTNARVRQQDSSSEAARRVDVHDGYDQRGGGNESPFRPSQRTGSVVLPPGPPARTTLDLEAVRRKGRENVARSKMGQANLRPFQIRQPYTAEQEARLTDLIEQYGPGYSNIKMLDSNHEDGALLEDRSQVQLKDKAQELKFQFLKARYALPINFEYISLRKRMKEDLEKLGIYEA